MKKLAAKDIIVGFSVTSRSIHAAVIERGSEGPTVVKQFSRPRARMDIMHDDAAMYAEPTASHSQFAEIEADDPEVRFDAAPADAGNVFLASEFSVEDAPSSNSGMASGEMGMQPSTVEIELTELLDEIKEEGYEHAGAAFCMGLSDLFTHELRVPRSENKKKDKAPDRDKLLALLGEQKDVRFDPELTVFIPMTLSENDERRVLAVSPRPSEPIIPTLRRLSERNRPLPLIELIDTEVTLLLGLARVAELEAPVGADARRMVVRVGAEDTVVFFLESGNLQYFETLRSVTTFDAPETICSRILLLQDEYGIGDADEILVLGEDQEEVLIDRFASFFPDRTIRSLRALIPAPEDLFDGDRSREAALASAAGMRIVASAEARERFEAVNLIPKKLSKRRRIQMRFNWQVAAMMLILFATTLFFVGRFFNQRHQAEMLQLKLSQYSPGLVSGNARTLQARIDSMQAAAAGYVRALDVLDSMLVGSDRWSRAMERTAYATSAIPGVWVETWEETGGQLALSGTATNRDQVVRLAARLDATVQNLSFSKIRDWPVYSFTMNVTLPNELPEAALYLREQAKMAGASDHWRADDSHSD